MRLTAKIKQKSKNCLMLDMLYLERKIKESGEITFFVVVFILMLKKTKCNKKHLCYIKPPLFRILKHESIILKLKVEKFHVESNHGLYCILIYFKVPPNGRWIFIKILMLERY